MKMKKKRKKGLEENKKKKTALSGSVTLGEDTWLIDSVASKNMMRQNKTLSKLEEKKSPQKVS